MRLNNKGFTLVEVLVTIVLLSIVMGIATYSVWGVINNSKARSEYVFVNKFENILQSYISKNRINWRTGSFVGNFDKCRRVKSDGTCLNNDERESKKLYKVGSPLVDSSFNISLFASEEYIKGGKIVNPKNKFNCLDDGKDPSVRLFKDEDSVFYYYVDLSGTNTSCDIDDSNAIVSNISKNMCSVLSGEGYSWNNDKEVCVKG